MNSKTTEKLGKKTHTQMYPPNFWQRYKSKSIKIGFSTNGTGIIGYPLAKGKKTLA